MSDALYPFRDRICAHILITRQIDCRHGFSSRGHCLHHGGRRCGIDRLHWEEPREVGWIWAAR